MTDEDRGSLNDTKNNGDQSDTGGDETSAGISLSESETALLTGVCYGLALGSIAVSSTGLGAITVIVGGIASGWLVGKL